MRTDLLIVSGNITATHTEQDGDELVRWLDGPNIIVSNSYFSSLSSADIIGQQYTITYEDNYPKTLELLGIIIQLQ